MPQFGQAGTGLGACDIVRVIVVDMGSCVLVMRRHEAGRDCWCSLVSFRWWRRRISMLFWVSDVHDDYV